MHAADAAAGASRPAAVLEAHGLSKRYGSTQALEQLDLRLSPGEAYGYLGPNGAGKTTTIRLMLGLHRPSSGTCRLFGLDAWAEAVAAHRRVAYVPGEPALWPSLTAAETLDYLARLRGGVDERYRAVLIERFELEADRRVRALSKGNRQKVLLVAAFAARADLLVMDEPTAGLDPLMALAFRETVSEARERGQTVFLSSHMLGEVEALCDRIGILRAGRLVDEGTLAELRHLAAQQVEISFAGPAPDLPPLPGVSGQQVDGQMLRLELSGPIAPLIDALGGRHVTSLQTHAPSLEEIFLRHYRGGGDARRR